jgi:hypothetical protein
MCTICPDRTKQNRTIQKQIELCTRTHYVLTNGTPGARIYLATFKQD